MSDIGTYSIDENKLQLSNDNLKKHTTDLLNDLTSVKNISELSSYISIIEEKVIPVLQKYSSKMDELIEDNKKVKKETI